MKSYRNTAVIAGVLYITGTVAGILSIVFTGPVLNSRDYLDKISTNENMLITGSLFILIMGIALAMIPAVMFPVLRKINEPLAIGYIIFRGALETFTYIITAFSWLSLIRLFQLDIHFTISDLVNYKTLGLMLQDTKMISCIATIVFILGALMFYFMLYKSGIVPRWISGWGLISALPYLTAGILVLFGLIDHKSTWETVLFMPLAIQEMVLAVWLIVRGFNSLALTSLTVKGT